MIIKIIYSNIINPGIPSNTAAIPMFDVFPSLRYLMILILPITIEANPVMMARIPRTVFSECNMPRPKKMKMQTEHAAEKMDIPSASFPTPSFSGM